MLTPTYRLEVTKSIFKKAFERNSIFAEQPEIIIKLIQGIFPSLQQPDDEIVTQGDVANSFYFIAEGKCSINYTNHKREDVYQGELGKSDYFGEVGLIHECLRSVTVKSINYCTFAKVSKNDFNSLCPCFRQTMRERTYEYDDEIKRVKLRLLK